MAKTHPLTLLTLTAVFSLFLSPGLGSNNVLYSGKGGILDTSEKLTYKNYTLTMRYDCNLVVYESGSVIWQSGTSGLGQHCFLQLKSNGELVIYNSRIDIVARAVWSSHATSIWGNYALVLQYDGRFKVYGPLIWEAPARTDSHRVTAGSNWISTTDSTLWSNDVAPIGPTIVNKDYALVLQDNCNLTLSNTVSGKVLWDTNKTFFMRDCFVMLEANGELKVKYLGGEILWTNGVSSTYGEYVLTLQPNGTLLIFGPSIWSSDKVNPRPCCDHCGPCKGKSLICQCLDLASSCHALCQNCKLWRPVTYPRLYYCADFIHNICDRKCYPKPLAS